MFDARFLFGRSWCRHVLGIGRFLLRNYAARSFLQHRRLDDGRGQLRTVTGRVKEDCLRYFSETKTNETPKNSNNNQKKEKKQSTTKQLCMYLCKKPKK